MRKPPAATIFTWLKNNDIRLGGLTDHDAAALQAAAQVAELWIRGDYENRPRSAVAFANCVSQMQPKVRYMAFHAIAHVGDWSHRWELWREAGLPEYVLQHVPECTFAPRREAAAA